MYKEYTKEQGFIMTAQIFPIIISPHSRDPREYSRNQWDALAKTFHNIRQGRTWYSYEVTIHNLNTASFKAYGMKDPVYGGTDFSQVLFEAHNVEITDTSELIAIGKVVSRKAYQLAADKRAEELLAAEELIIEGYAQDILKQVTL